MAAIDTYLKEAQAAGERAQSVHAEAMEEAAAEARRIEEEERRLLEERKSIEEERKQRRIRAYEALNRVRSGELSPEDQSPHGAGAIIASSRARLLRRRPRRRPHRSYARRLPRVRRRSRRRRPLSALSSIVASHAGARQSRQSTVCM